MVMSGRGLDIDLHAIIIIFFFKLKQKAIKTNLFGTQFPSLQLSI